MKMLGSQWPEEQRLRFLKALHVGKMEHKKRKLALRTCARGGLHTTKHLRCNFGIMSYEKLIQQSIALSRKGIIKVCTQ